MRTFIQDKKLEKILDIVEQILGYPVNATPLDSTKSGLYDAGVRHANGSWKFFVSPGKKISGNTLCHEILHIVQCLEGYPEHRFALGIIPNSPEYLMLIQVFHNLQHSVLWPRVIKLGYRNEEEKEITGLLKQSAFTGMCRGWPESYNVRIVANIIQSVLLMPIDDSIKTRIMRRAAIEKPKSLALAQKINDALSDYFPLTPQSYIPAIRKNLTLIGFPEDILSNDVLEQPVPGLFEKISAAASRNT